ncbi:histidine phosphatase family protein [Algoriphagus aestuariicola]|jgi:phosphohistidine phosphatase|uniref:Histidine phosphatase family protein n=1 Tax=Algoriphagus aestuariicola TaxID=1852016 RepID=A0ABS3BJT1_9BACT|nr:histidine phosphatase family protein [Algoriphagus aestuariicola]MBN7799526.1 histidine phosphatase family protein [Algoriphagus aestuariicola]
MKKIILVRHAKSAWDNPNLSDHDRPLAERGLNDAPRMAKRLKNRGIHADLLLSSSALRAKETAKIIAKELGYPKDKIILEPSLFHASPHAILKYLQSQDDRHQTVLVFGHNPGFTDLIVYLGGDIDNLPTSGQFGFKLKSGFWKDLKPENVEPWFVDYPKKHH